MEREYIGIDLHKAFFHVCAVTETGERQWEQRWPTDDAGIAGLLARCGPQSRVAVEASSPTWAFVDRIVGSRRGGARRRCPQDAVEGRLRGEDGSPRCAALGGCVAARQRGGDLLSAAGDSRPARAVPVSLSSRAPAGESEAADPRVAAAARASTAPVKRLFAQRGHRLAGRRSTLPGWAGAESAAACGRCSSTCGRSSCRCWPRFARPRRPIRSRSALDARPGFGPVFSVTLRAEVGTITRFPDGPHLASYAGLVPRVERSGGRQWSGRITKTGSPWLRWALIEAAIHQFRRQDDFGRWARQLAVRKGNLESPRRGGARAVRRAPRRRGRARRPLRVDGRRRHDHRGVDL